VFESVAAMNGVGLSTGLSLHLTWAGRLVMIGVMVVGCWAPVVFWARLVERVSNAECGMRNAE
jgi:Trk-type K+ transport system membrane component